MIKNFCCLALTSLTVVSVEAQLKYEGCDDIGPNSAEIKKTILVGRVSGGATPGVTAVDNTLKEPIRVAVAKNGDVYWAEREGALKVYKAQTATVVNTGKLDVFFGGAGGLVHPSGSRSNNEYGLIGMVLDPNFTTNRYIYLEYAPKTDTSLYVSRFTLNGDVLDKASEKIILKIPQQRRWCCHTGGAMVFDFHGNLYITVGNNTRNIEGEPVDAYLRESDPDADDQGHSANTNDLRGKILKITPTAAGTYTIPKGNLYPEGTANTRPEIWAMGMRNPYTMDVDKYRGWVVWGDVGPDEGGMQEEHNLFTKPGFGGWPYYAGTGEWRPLGKNVAAPTNNSKNNTGLKVLPPAIPAAIPYKQSSATTGPFYYYDGANASKRKFPPHFNKKWFISDWKVGWLDVVTLDDNGGVVSRMNLLPAQSLGGPLSFDFGPDGALYVAEYGFTYFGVVDNATRIRRLEYTGTCQPATPVLPPIPSSVNEGPKLGRISLLPSIKVGLNRDLELPAGVKGFRLYDIQGRMVWEYKVTGMEAGKVSVPAQVAASGVLRVKFFQ